MLGCLWCFSGSVRVRAIILSLVTLFSMTSFAAEKFSDQCRNSGISFEQNDVSFFSQHTAKPRLYAITNHFFHPIWLTNSEKSAGVGAGWDSQLSPHQWSVLLVTQKNFSLKCHWQKKPGVISNIPCDKVITVCQFSDFTVNHPVSGGYWVTENILFSQLIPRIQKRGFAIPDSRDTEAKREQ